MLRVSGISLPSVLRVRYSLAIFVKVRELFSIGKDLRT